MRKKRFDSFYTDIKRLKRWDANGQNCQKRKQLQEKLLNLKDINLKEVIDVSRTYEILQNKWHSKGRSGSV